jgi:predicted phosphodiesterase
MRRVRIALTTGVLLLGVVDLAGAFTFAVIGDIQNDTYSQRLYSKSVYVASMNPAFWIPVGDLVNNSEVTSWAAWHQYMAPLETQSTCYPVVGNHDDDGSGGLSLFKAQFPHVQWEGTQTYHFTHDDALFIVLKCYQGDDLAWLEDLLRNNTKKWVFVFKHNPLYSTGGGHATAERGWYTETTDMIERYDVNAAFSGHTHMFETVKPIKGGEIVGSYAEGTFYYNTNGFGWAGVATGDMPWSLKVATKELQDLFAMVEVSDSQAVVTTWDIETNSVYDRTVLPARRGLTPLSGGRASLRVPYRSGAPARAYDLAGRGLGRTEDPAPCPGVYVVARGRICDLAVAAAAVR